ncbi:sodium-dependent transporter [Thermococcus thioreducens]|uniref:Transporter n=1 Tax=Thermococcus thioreducens TaxID=277988 RepID=A0A0Q2UPY2_9EURY|nr:sodium-dependent transporter [Thermococcus thioreducens]ASJ12017.1 hypothetical protein A3L14_03560 [Thermococcus thioreducens]KQH82760.1 hypothetical protein AMR53_04005 [Thermococcus thioreducens]SEW09954.1 hypothetical protein SAMN05216170_1561 [Thermococcus thioreducens]
MDDVKKWTLYMTFLVAGFATGIGTLGLFPQFWLKYGLTGLAVHVLFLALFAYVAILEAETVMKSGYYFVELYHKLFRRRAMIISILVAVIIFLSYYTANTMLSILAPLLGTGTVGRLIAKVLMFALIFVVLTRAKEKSFAIMAFGSLVFVVAVAVTAVAFKTQIPENATFLGMAKHMLVARTSLSLDLIRDAAMRAAYGVGLGFAFYLMLGSFLNERFNPRVIIGAGVLLQFFVSVLSTIIVVYAIAPSTPERLLTYVYGGEEGAIALMAELPTLLKDYQVLLLLIAISVFFAGLTSLLPTAEVGLQIVESMLRVGRNRATTYLIGASLAVGVIDAAPSVADMALKAVTVSIFFTSIYELWPVLNSKEKRPAVMGASILAALLFLVGGVYALITTFKAGGIYIASGILAMVIVGFGLIGDGLLPAQEEV